MAQTRWYLDATTVDGWAIVDQTAATAATYASGWVVGTGSLNSSEFQSTGGDRASSTFTANTVPDGTLDTTLKDAFRSRNPINGSFAAGNWTFQFAVQGTVQSGAADGQIVFRLIKANFDGSSATEITSAQQVCTSVNNVTTTDLNSGETISLGAFTVTNQYLFIQVAWKRTGAGGMTTTNVRLRTGSSTTVGTTGLTADFTNAPVTTAHIASTLVVRVPTVVPPVAAVTGQTISTSAAMFLLTVVLGPAPQAVTGEHIVSTAQAPPPKVEVEVAHIASTVALHVPLVEGGAVTPSAPYHYKVSLEVQSGFLSGTLTDWVAPIAHTFAPWKYVTEGGRLENYDPVLEGGLPAEWGAFADEALTQPLPFEITYWNPYTGYIAAWVRMSSIATATTIWIGYKDPAKLTSDSDGPTTWEGFEAVFHIDGENDVTGNGHELNLGSYGIDPNTKIVGVAGYFASGSTIGTYDGILTAPPLTMSCWIKPETSVVDTVFLGALNSAEEWSGFYLQTYSSGTLAVGTIQTGAIGAEATKTGLTTAWNHVAGVIASATSRKAYVGGVAGTENTTSMTPPYTPDNFSVGAGWQNDTTSFPFTGHIDEVRVLRSVRLDSHIAADAVSQFDPSAFWTLGTEEVALDGIYTTFITSGEFLFPPEIEGGASGFTWKVPLVVQSGQVTGTVTGGFIAVIYHTFASWAHEFYGGKIQAADYYPWDLAFYSDSALTTLLPHHVIEWDPETGFLNAWVRLEEVAVGATIWVAYGDPDVDTNPSDMQAVAAGLTAFYHLDDIFSGFWADAADNYHLVNTNGTVSTGSKQYGASASFNGTSAIARNTDSPITGPPFTISGWIKPLGALTGVPVGVLVDGGLWNGWYFGMSSTYISFTTVRDNFAATAAASSPIAPVTNTWMYFTAVLTTNAHRVMHANGIEGTPDTTSLVPLVTPDNFTLGAMYNSSGSGAGNFCNCLIDEVQIHPSARTFEWSEAQYNNQWDAPAFWVLGSEVPVLPPATDLMNGLVAYYQCEDAANTNLEDSHGSISNPPYGYYLTANNNPGSATGKIDNGRSLNNADHSRFEANYSIFAPDDSFVWSLWVYLQPTGTEDSPFIFARWSGSTAAEYFLACAAGGKFTFNVRSATGPDISVPTASFATPAENVWHHVICYYDIDLGEIGLIVNGVFASAEVPDGVEVAGGGSGIGLAIGKLGANSWDEGYFTGRVDEIGFWKGRVLNPAERTALYNGGAGLAYPFEEGGGGDQSITTAAIASTAVLYEPIVAHGIAFDASNHSQISITTTNSSNITIGAGANRILFIHVLTYKLGAAPVVTAITVDGNVPTLVTQVNNSGGGYGVNNYLYHYVAPPVGSVNISVTTDISCNELVVDATSYFNAHQTLPINASSTGTSGAASSFTIGITPAVANCWAVASIENHAAVINAVSGCVFRAGIGGGGGIFDSNGQLPASALHNFVVDVSSGTPTWSGNITALRPFVPIVGGQEVTTTAIASTTLVRVPVVRRVYDYYVPLTVQASQVTGTVTQFVAHFNHTFAPWKSVANGGRIVNNLAGLLPCDWAVFADVNQTQPLSFEVTSWNAATGATAGWINTPVATGQTVYIGYGNSSVAVPQGDAQATWALADGFVFVAHLDVLGVGGTIWFDETENEYDLTNFFATQATGKIGDGAAFNVASVANARRASAVITATPLTLSGWLRRDTGSFGGQVFLSATRSDASLNGFTVHGTDTDISFSTSDGSSLSSATQTGPPIDNTTWSHFAGVSANATSRFIYLNGVASAENTTSRTPAATIDHLIAGALWINNTRSQHLSGRLDELRVHNVARSAAWIEAEYHSQNDPTAFWVLGSEVDVALIQAITGAHISTAAAFDAAPLATTYVAGGVNGGTTSAIDTTGANAIFIVIGCENTTPTVTDSYGNVYTFGAARTTSVIGTPTKFFVSRLGWCFNPIVGPGHTFSIAMTAGYPTLSVQAWRNVDAAVGEAGRSSSSFSAQNFILSGVVSPVLLGELLVVGEWHMDNGGPAVYHNPLTPGWTSTSQIPYVDANNYGGGMAYKIVTADGNDSLSWLFTNSVLRSIGLAGRFVVQPLVRAPRVSQPPVTVHIASTTIVRTPRVQRAFLYKVALTVQASQIDGTLTDYPALISHTFAGWKDTANGGRITGWDVGMPPDWQPFADAALTQPLAYEHLNWDSSTGFISAYVKVPSIANGTTIYIGYGQSSVTLSAWNGPATWSNGFAAVYHFGPGNLNGLYTNPYLSGVDDSTGNNRDFTAFLYGTNNITPDGGTCATFNGSTYHAHRAAQVVGAPPLTMSCWLYPYPAGAMALSLLSSASDFDGFYLYVDISGSPVVQCVTVANNFATVGAATAPIAVNTAWQHVAGVIASGTSRQVYVNTVAGTPNTTGVFPLSTIDNLTAGAGRTVAGYVYRFAGAVDEIRIATVARSEAWIGADYRNQGNVAAFWVLGSEEFVSELAVTTTHIASTLQIFLPVVTEAGATSVGGVTITATLVINQPTVAPGAVAVTGAFIAAGLTAPLATTSVAGTASGGTTPAIDTTGAAVIFLAAGWNDTTTTNPTFSDSYGNTYSFVASRTSSTTGPTTFYELRIVACFNPIVGPGHTFSIAGTNIFPALSVQAWPSGIGLQVDGTGSTLSSSAFANSGVLGNLNPLLSGELMVACEFHMDNGGAIVTLNDPVTPGWTMTSNIPWSATNFGGGMAYKIAPTVGNHQLSWRLTNVTLRTIGVSAAFEPMAGAHPPAVAVGAVTIGGVTVAPTSALTQPIIAVGAVTITGVHRASTVALFQPTLTALLAGATIPSGSGLSPPTLLVHQSVTTAHRATTATLSLPTVALAAIQNVTTQPIAGGTVIAPSVATGPVAVTTAFRTTTATVNIPVVALAGVTNISGVTIAATVVTAPTVATGPVAVTTATRTTTIQVFAPTVAYGQVGATIASGNQRFVPMVASTLTLATISATSQVFLPIVAAAGTTAIGLTFTTTTSLVNVPTVSAGPVSVTTGTRTTSIQVFVPSVAPGPASVVGATIPSGNQRFVPTIGVGPASVTSGNRATTLVVYPPTVTALGVGAVGGANIPTGSQVFQPSVVGGLAIIFPPVITATLVVRVPTVTTGPVSVTVGNRPTTLQVFVPSVAPGAVTVLGTTIVSTTQVHALSVTLNITTAAIAATGLLFLPVVFVAGEDLSLGGATVTTTELLYPPSVGLAGTGPITPFDVVESCGIKVQQLVAASAIDCTQLMTSKCVKVEMLISSTVKGSQ